MTDKIEILIWCMMIIPLLIFILSMFSHPTLILTQTEISDNPITKQQSSNESVRDLQSVLSPSDWSNYQDTKQKIISINENTDKEIHVCGENSTKNVSYPSPDGVIFYDKLDDKQRKLFQEMKSNDITIERKLYYVEESNIIRSYLFRYSSYSDKTYEVSGTQYNYDEVKPFFDKSAILSENCKFYEIKDNYKETGGFGYLTNLDYTLLLLFSFGFIMDFLNTVIKRSNRYSNNDNKNNDNKNNRDSTEQRD